MRAALAKARAFFLGAWEFRLCVTWADPARREGEWQTPLDESYDWGREWAHRLTLRYWDD